MQHGPILAVLNTTKTNTRIRIFTQELSLDINYSSPFVQYPHYPIACFQHLCTVTHNCHDKSINLTAKRKTSRQKETLTANRITSRQKEKDTRQKRITSRCGKKKKTCGKKKNLKAKRKKLKAKRKPHGKKKKTQNFFDNSYFFCREVVVILSAVRLFFLP